MRDGVLFSGYYGLGNAGDEAVLAASVDLFRARRPSLRISALTADPKGTRETLGIEAAPRMQLGAIPAQLRRCRLFLSGGGSLIQDKTSLKSLLYYLMLLRWAKRAGAKTMIFAQGIGPLVRPSARRLTARILSEVDMITVRDADSADLLQQIGVGTGGTPPVEVTADPVFALEPKVTARVQALSRRPSVAVSLRPWHGAAELLNPLARALSRFEGEVRFQAWPLFPAEDLAPCEALAAKLPGTDVVREALTPGEWMALAGWTDLVVGMRLHSLIFAAARSVPVLGLSYDPKVDALLGRLKAPLVGRPGEPLDVAKLEAAVAASLEENEARRRDREARSEHLRRQAARNVERALELLD